MNNWRKLKTMLAGQFITPLEPSSELQAAGFPLTTASCRNCADPCDQGHEEYPKKFDVDMVADLLGSVKPYRRQVVISTGKRDWEKEVTEAKGTLASYLLEAESKSTSQNLKTDIQEASSETVQSFKGVYRTSQMTRLSILNGSHCTVSDDSSKESVLVFPDYKLVTEVPCSLEGARDLWSSTLDPSLGRLGRISKEVTLKSWLIPYSCVILLCSHKKRDNRCSVAAPKLEATLKASLECQGWEVHTQLEDSPEHTSTLEERDGIQEGQEESIMDQLRALRSLKRALVLCNSHIGGHKFAGNCIIHFPLSSIWYGRVTPHEIEAIVKNTIIDGKVLPPLLRAGVDIEPGCKSVHDW